MLHIRDWTNHSPRRPMVIQERPITKTYPLLNNIKHNNKIKVQSQVFIAQTDHKQAVWKHYKQVVLHSKSSEAIRCLYAKKRVKHKVLIAENDPAPLTRSHLIQNHTPFPAIGHETHKSQWHFHNQGWRKASSGGIFLNLRMSTDCSSTQEELYSGQRWRSRLFLSQINRFASEDLEY